METKKKVTYIDQFKIIAEPQADFNRLEKCKITCSGDCYKFAQKLYNGDLEVYESFFVALLNRQNSTKGWARISQGGVSGTVTDIRMIAKHAVELLASSVVLVHNHPSGNIKPSQADMEITKRVKQVLELFDIKVLDHIILAEDNYFSFADEGLV